MKTKIVLLAITILSYTVHSQNWVEFLPAESTEPIVNILNSDSLLVEFEVLVAGMFDTPIDTFNRVEIKGHTKLDSVGYPEVPVVSFLVAIPECGDINLNIDLKDSLKFSNYNIYPAPELVPDSTPEGYKYLREEFIYNETAYSTDSYFPGIISETIDRGAVRAQQCIRVLFYPVQFNPVTKSITVYSEVKISLAFTNPTGPVNNNVGIFNEMLGNSMINYISNGLNASVSCGAGEQQEGDVHWVTTLMPGERVNENCDYLIITHDELIDEQPAYDALDAFATHRATYNGFDVAIVTISLIEGDISGEDNAERIFYLINNTYLLENANNTYDGKLAYVNLFGDAFFDDEEECIATNPYYDPQGYDVVYTQLTIPPTSNDPDIYPDLMIGRCSVDDNDHQLQNVVTKITGFTPYLYPYNDKVLNFIGEEPNGWFDDQSEVIQDLEVIFGNSFNNELIYTEDYYGYLPENWYLQSFIDDPGPIVTASYSTGQMFF